MKHPALTRVMAVVLIIACSAMLISGAFGLGEAQTKYNADIEEYDKLNERIATYKELSAKLDGEDSYKETIEKLDARQEQHDKDASDYRTDLAERTATQGGYKQGADALWEAKAQTDAAYKQYQDAVLQFQAAEAEYNAQIAQLDSTLASISQVQQACAGAAQLTVPPAPGTPDPRPIGDAPVEGDYVDNPDGYAAAKADWDAKAQLRAEWDTYNATKAQIEGNISGAVGAANAILGQMGAGAVGDAASAAGALGMVAQQLNAAKAEAQQKFEAGRAQLQAAGEAVNAAKGKVDGSLEQIWYDLGKLEDEEPELEENKQKLLDEAEQLEQDKKAAEQKKEDERKLSSTRAALKNYDGVAALLAENDDLAACAESYSDSFFAELNQNRVIRLIIAALEVVGGALGFLCLAPAYEKSKSRFMLLAPAAASLLLAAAALCMALYFGFGMNYAALPVLIFAPIYLLAAAPKNKIPAEATAEPAAPTAEE